MTTPDHSPVPRFLLRLQAGPNAGREYPLQPGKVTLGRDPANDVVLEDDSVSPRHARLDHADGGWRLTDLCSTNGTRVDGERLPEDTPTPLPSGTELALGGVKLLLDVQEEPEEAQEESAAEPASRPGPAVGSGVHAPVSAGEGAGTTPSRRMKLPLWAVVLAILVIVVIAILLIAAAPAGLVATEAALLLDNVLFPPPVLS